MDAYLLALLFDSAENLTKKVRNFSSRFDPKSHLFPGLAMPILPSIPVVKKKDFNHSDVQEELEAYLFGGHFTPNVMFDQIDVFQGKKNILNLRPTLDSDLIHCQEGLDEYFLSENSHYKTKYYHRKKRKEVFLSLGRFQNMSQLDFALGVAGREFQFPLILRPKSLSLFKKSYGRWYAHSEIYSFYDEGEVPSKDAVSW